MVVEDVTTGFEGLYEVSEAAHYILVDTRHPEARYRLNSRHLIRWIRSGLSDPRLKDIPGRQMLITFEDLVSMRVIALLRAFKYSFHRIRIAEATLRRITGHHRPFATDDIWAEKEGRGDIFGKLSTVLLTATRHGQLGFKQLLRENLTRVHNLTFDQRGIAITWEPRPGILLSPRIQFGRPCIAGTRIPTHDIAGMVGAGDSIEFLAKSYAITSEELKRALDWEREIADT